MRTAPAILASLVAKLPPGWVLAQRRGVLDALLEGIAGRLGEAEADAEILMDEVDPRQSVRLLPDFERVLGPDPCGRDLGERTLEQRQRQAHQRWTARGGQSIPYFIDLAARLGVEIRIEEYWPSQAGVLVAGAPLIAEGEQFTWVVALTLIDEWWFRAGQNVAGDPLGGLTLSDIECELRRLKPAHTQLVFSYRESLEDEIPGAFTLLGDEDGFAFDFTDGSYAGRTTVGAETLLGEDIGFAIDLTDGSFAMRPS